MTEQIAKAEQSLKTCPFCGGVGLLLDDITRWRAFCNQCDAACPWEEVWQAAADSWNKRN